MKILSVIAVTGLVSLLAAVPSSDAPNLKDFPCQLDEAFAWAEANPTSLPTTLEALEAFEQHYRRAILAASPVEVRIKLWQENIDAVLRRHPELGANQVSLLRKVQMDLPGYLSDAPDRESMQVLWAGIRQVLGEDIGGEALWRLGTVGTVNVLFEGECSCNIDWNCLAQQGECTGADCDIQSSGCGFLGLWECNGTCGF